MLGSGICGSLGPYKGGKGWQAWEIKSGKERKEACLLLCMHVQIFVQKAWLGVTHCCHITHGLTHGSAGAQMNTATLAYSWNGYWLLKVRSYKCTRRSVLCSVFTSAARQAHVRKLQGVWIAILEAHFRLWRISVQFSQGQWSVTLLLLVPRAHVGKNDLTVFLFPCSSLSRGGCVSHLWCIT